MTSAAKYAPAAFPLFSAGLAAHSDTIIKVAAVLGGLALGAMWRAGSMRGDGKSWAAVRADLGISALIGGANAVLALALVEIFAVGIMFAMAIGVIVGATGLRALPEIKEVFVTVMRRRLLGGDDVVVINPPKEMPPLGGDLSIPPDLKALARRLDEPSGRPPEGDGN